MSATTSATASATPSEVSGSAQAEVGVTITNVLVAIGTGIIASGVQLGIFIVLKNKLARIFIPKTYLVPESQRVAPPLRSPFGWLVSIFKHRDREIMTKCGLDAYFFLRYLQTLLIIFIPLAVLILPILLPINYFDGKGTTVVTSNKTGETTSYNVTGLDTVAWGNVAPNNTSRYWAHLILAIVVIVWVCSIFFIELRNYIRVRQDYLTSPAHRLRASATTVLVTAIPRKWLTKEALEGLYDVFPGGVRNIWINRDYSHLLNKITIRYETAKRLESAETALIRKCKKAQLNAAEKERKEQAKKMGIKEPTKEELRREAELQDLEANQRAHGEDISSSDRQTIEEDEEFDNEQKDEGGAERVFKKVPLIGGGLAAIGQGLGQGLGLVGNQVGKAGQNIIGGAQNVGKDVDKQLETTNGFVAIGGSEPSNPADRKEIRAKDDPWSTGKTENGLQFQKDLPPVVTDQDVEVRSSSKASSAHENPFGQHLNHSDATLQRVSSRIDGAQGATAADQKNSWWKFWHPPPGGFPSPKPHGYENEEEFPFLKAGSSPTDQHSPNQQTHGLDGQTDGSVVANQTQSTSGSTSGGAKLLNRLKALLPGFGQFEPNWTYDAYEPRNHGEDIGEPAWEQYIKKEDRPTHRLIRFHLPLLPTLPYINTKVDTIDWCREQIARLNIEIETDKMHADEYPFMNSAFIQFNHQVAAHMAAQAISHHIPKQMAPRLVEISPADVIWQNMSIRWYETWFRTAAVIAIVTAMCVLWAFPVSATTLLGNLPALIQTYPWLGFLWSVQGLFKYISGVLPAIILFILFMIVPIIFYKLATLQGLPTGTLRELSVSNYYFFFLFIQVFLVVSIASGAIATITAAASNITSIPETLAINLPKAANYFFSYMIIQALSVSAGNLLQVVALLGWFVFAKLLDSTPRQKWRRNVSLQMVTWGSYFPTYTNFACIALIYSVITPLIMVFGIITFALFWIANRYGMLYVYSYMQDTGGLLYPQAIYQTFTGLYVMELCLIGLFFLVRDQDNNAACTPQAGIMIAVTVLTVIYHYLLNQSFGPLLKYLPITLEDDAVLRDEAFARAQAVRGGRLEDEEQFGVDGASEKRDRLASARDGDIELQKISNNPGKGSKKTFNERLHPRNIVVGGARAVGNLTIGDPSKVTHRGHGERDLKAQRDIGNALFGNFPEAEDLSPEQREIMVRQAFLHLALRVKAPNIWIPRDDLGVSDDEIKRTREEYNGIIEISNDGTALDSKCRSVYGKNPPDFDPRDTIQL